MSLLDLLTGVIGKSVGDPPAATLGGLHPAWVMTPIQLHR